MFSQNITLHVKEVSVKTAMETLKEKNGYSFVFESKDVDTKKIISVALQNKPIDDVVKQILQGQDLSYEIKGKNIIIKKKNTIIDPQAPGAIRKKITGVVIDERDMPIIGANVSEKGTTNGTITDLNGEFSLEMNQKSVLLVSYIGYTPKEISIKDQTLFTIKLTEDAQALGEIIVTALGMKREKKALGYAIQEVPGSSLVEARDVNIANALSGKVSGLQIIKGSGGPAGSSKILLRGQRSLTGNNQPLIVVDGIPINNFTGGSSVGLYGGIDDKGSGISDINPEDIESMSVLKGASAAALYGSRAGNGVILITTKQGRQTEGLGITVSAGITMENILTSADMQKTFGQGDYGLYNDQSRSSWGPKAEGQTVKDYMGRDIPLHTYDNIGSFYGTGVIATENVTFEKIIKKTSLFSSVTRMDDKSMIPETNLNRTNFTTRMTTTLGEGDKWHLDTKFSYINAQAENRPTQGLSQSNSFFTLQTLPVSVNIKDFNPSIDKDGNAIWYDTQNTPQDNPWWTQQYNKNSDERERLMGMIALSYDITDWLNAEIKGGTDLYSTREDVKKHSGGSSNPDGEYVHSKGTFKETNFSFQTIAKKDNLISKLGGVATFGGNMMHQKSESMYGQVKKLLVPNLFSLNNAIDKPNISEGFSEKKINSLYGMIQANWDGYVFLDLTFRNDWSSSMSKENRSFFYPSASLSAVVSDMITKNGGSMPDWFSFAKLRLSYAEVGNDLGAYQLYNQYYIGKDAHENTIAWPDGTLYDPSVRSELIKSKEVGIDLRFLNNRLHIDASWYRTNATRQLLNLPMDPSSGYRSKKINAGDIQNEGFEIMASAAIIESAGGFSWDLTTNISRNVNKIIDLYPGITEYGLANVEGAFKVTAPIGGKYGEMYGYKALRVEDESSPYYGQIIVDGNGLPQAGKSWEHLGCQQPDLLVGLTNRFSYKGISLSVLLDMRFGGKIYSGTTSQMSRYGTAAGTVVNGERADFVVPDAVMLNENGEYIPNTKEVSPRNYWVRVSEFHNIGIAEYFTYDASNIRIRNLTVGYDFNRDFLQKTPFTKLRLSAVANNLWLIKSHLPGVDPEAVMGTGTNVSGFELGAPPSTRSFTFNLTVGF